MLIASVPVPSQNVPPSFAADHLIMQQHTQHAHTDSPTQENSANALQEVTMEAVSCSSSRDGSENGNCTSNNNNNQLYQHKHSDIERDHPCICIQSGEVGSREYQLHQLQVWLSAWDAEIRKRELALRSGQSEQRKQLQVLRLDLERKDAELEVMQAKVSCLVEAKVDLQEELQMIKSQAKFKQAELQQEVQKLKEELSELKLLSNAQNTKNSQGESDAQQEISQLKKTIQQLQSQNQNLMVELDALAEQQNARYVMPMPTVLEEPPQEQLNQRIRELEAELHAERETCVELREQLVAVRWDLNGKVDNLEMQLQLQRMKSAQVEKQLLDASAGNSAVVGSGDGVSASSVSSSIEQMAVKYAEELQEADMRAVEAEMRIDQLSQALNQKEDEMCEAQKNLISLRKNLLNKNNQVVALTSQVNDYQNRLRAKTGQLEIAQSQVDSYRKKSERFKKLCEQHRVSALQILGYFGPQIVRIGTELSRGRENDQAFHVHNKEGRVVEVQERCPHKQLLKLGSINYGHVICYIFQLHIQMQLQMIRQHYKNGFQDWNYDNNNSQGGTPRTSHSPHSSNTRSPSSTKDDKSSPRYSPQFSISTSSDATLMEPSSFILDLRKGQFDHHLLYSYTKVQVYLKHLIDRLLSDLYGTRSILQY